MAFRPLTEAECGQVNPLTKLTSHVTHDHAFSLNHGQMFPSSSDQLVEQFLQETRAVPQSFRMDDLMREMQEIESQRSILPPIPASTIKDQLHDDAWAQQYIEDGKVFHENKYQEIWTEINAQNTDVNALDEAWSNELAQYTDEASGNIDDSKFAYSKFMKFMKTADDNNEVNLEASKITEADAQGWADEYLDTDEQKLAENWASEFVKTDDEEVKAFWDKLQDEMKKVSSDYSDTVQPWLDEFNSYYPSPQKEYQFSDTNPMLDIKNPVERGKQLLQEGDYPSAVLCFEAAVKQQPDNVEAWLLLGQTQAENEQDPSAIAALNECLQLDPKNLTGIMALAVSYTNESYYNQACHMLLNWLKHNPKYEHLFTGSNANLSWENQKIVQDLYIKAVQENPQTIDYEVQCGLGVLCNLTGEYDKAVDCFRTALSVKPDDARLWNRLGATLANGSKPEEAVDAYHHALNLSPGYIRARYNVGITCINLNAYQEAVEHFLTALNQQARGRDVLNTGAISEMSDTIWSTLRMCIALMNRSELRPLVDSRNLQELNKIFKID